jgi:hypothetical protein
MRSLIASLASVAVVVAAGEPSAAHVAAASASTARAEIIDRVLATVEGQIITLSDVRAAQKFGLVPADVSTDPVFAALQRLIDRQLILAEVERYAPPEPPEAAVDAAVSAIAGRFQDALAFETALNQSPLTRDELRRFVRDTLRVEAYERQRFAISIQPPDDDVARYYREHPAQFTAGGVLQPLDAVRDAARQALVEERRSAAIQDWLEGLRRRASIVVLYLPGRI